MRPNEERIRLVCSFRSLNDFIRGLLRTKHYWAAYHGERGQKTRLKKRATTRISDENNLPTSANLSTPLDYRLLIGTVSQSHPRRPHTMASPLQDPGSSQKPYNDPTPMPKEVPSVTELGTTSAPLKSAAFFIGAYCKDYNGDHN